MKDFIQQCKYHPLTEILRRASYLIRELTHRPKHENLALKDIYKGKCFHLLGNGPSLNTHTNLPYEHVLIFNHFWRHPHYKFIKNGLHFISDRLFLEAEDINDFYQNYNDQITIFTTDKIARVLRKNRFSGIIITVHYSGSQPIWRTNKLSYDLTRTLQTASTVVADFGMPFIAYTGISEVVCYGLDFDYGKNFQNYAFDATKSQTVSNYYIKHLWYKRARTSTNKWISWLQAHGVNITMMQEGQRH